jgi:DNA-binding GntR family transcriptional regulator
MAPKMMMPDFEDLNTHLYRQVKQMIWDRVLPPGSKIKQEYLAQQLNVSRTPLIKILQRLTSEHLVEYVPRRGFFVKKLTPEEMLEIFAVRQVVEGVSAKAVAENATAQEIAELKRYFEPFAKDARWTKELESAYKHMDHQFHSKMIEIAGNRLLFEINEMFNIYTFSYQKGLARRPAETLGEHLDIIAAIERREPLTAQNLAMAHIENSRKNIMRLYREKGLINGDFI